jgi:hypothetical protein
MKTLEQIRDRRLTVPMTVSWYLSDIGHAQGLQELFTRQSPQRLKVLREHAIAQSAVSSNRIEGVEIDQTRIGTVVFGHPALKDRDEEEVAGYRDALLRRLTTNLKNVPAQSPPREARRPHWLKRHSIPCRKSSALQTSSATAQMSVAI